MFATQSQKHFTSGIAKIAAAPSRICMRSFHTCQISHGKGHHRRKQGRSYPKTPFHHSQSLEMPPFREDAPDSLSELREERIKSDFRSKIEQARTEGIRSNVESQDTADEYLNYNHAWASFYHQIAQSVPKSFLSRPMFPKLPDSWFTRAFPGYEMGKPDQFYQKFFKSPSIVGKWREGKLDNPEREQRFWSKHTPEFKSFKTSDKPLNPFRFKPQLVNRISFKNPRLLYPFITESGKIRSRRYTGLKRRAQKRITREIKKMRILGLASDQGNPEFGRDASQPMAVFVSFEDYSRVQYYLEHHEKKKQERENTIHGKIVWHRDYDTRAQLKKEYWGLTNQQLDEKKKDLTRLLVENEYLKQFGETTRIRVLKNIESDHTRDLLNMTDKDEPTQEEEKNT